MRITDVLTVPTLEFDQTRSLFCHSISHQDTFHLPQRGSPQVTEGRTAPPFLTGKCFVNSILDAGVKERNIEEKYLARKPFDILRDERPSKRRTERPRPLGRSLHIFLTWSPNVCQRLMFWIPMSCCMTRKLSSLSRRMRW